MAKLSSADIKSRLDNIKTIYRDYLKKINNIRRRERKILTESTDRIEKDQITEIRRSIRQENK